MVFHVLVKCKLLKSKKKKKHEKKFINKNKNKFSFWLKKNEKPCLPFRYMQYATKKSYASHFFLCLCVSGNHFLLFFLPTNPLPRYFINIY